MQSKCSRYMHSQTVSGEKGNTAKFEKMVEVIAKIKIFQWELIHNMRWLYQGFRMSVPKSAALQLYRGLVRYARQLKLTDQVFTLSFPTVNKRLFELE